jgi:hypothetical protein
VTVMSWWNVTAWPWRLTGIAGLILLAMLGAVWIAIDTWWLRRLRPAAAVGTLYERFRHQARRLALPMRLSDTPSEFAAMFAEWAAELSEEEYWDEWLEPTTQHARLLVDCYVQAVYTPHPLNPPDQQRVIWAWRKLHWLLWLARVRQIKLFGRKLFG